MSGDNFLNLTEVGLQSQIGKNYGGSGEDAIGRAKTHQANMEGTRAYFRGMGGNTFQQMGATTAMNSGFLARTIADQALRAVKGEKLAIGTDEETFQTQQSAVSTNDSHTAVVQKSINV